jgi:uncharacterized protein involved in exopolysaccharide biosynthesis
MSCKEPEIYRRYNADDEINLIDLFLIVWKRKWMIVVVTLLVTVIAAGGSLVLPEVYEVTAMLELAKDTEGNLVESPQTIREIIEAGSFDKAIAKNLNMTLTEIPELKVRTPHDTDLVKISVESFEREHAVLVVGEVLSNITAHIQKKLDPKIKETQNRMTVMQLDDALFVEQIELINIKTAQIRNKVADLEKERKEAKAKTGDDAMAVLLYSNEIQNQQNYAHELQGQLADIKIKKKQIEIKLDSIRLELERIQSTTIHQSPTLPEDPIKPKKIQIVALAFLLGLMGSILLAFGAEFINNVRQRQELEIEPKESRSE